MTAVINKEFHAKLLQDFDRVCTVAGLQGRFMYESMTVYCGSVEVDWVRNFRKYKAEGVAGLVLNGVSHPDTKCQAICAALLRNYIDARVIPLNSILDMQEEGTMPSPTVLLIPNLSVSFAGSSKTMPSFKVQAIYDILMQRAVRNKPTVVYVDDMTKLIATYGQSFADFLESGYKIAT